MSKFIANGKDPFTIRVGAKDDFEDIEGVLKDGRVTISNEEPTEVGTLSRTIIQSVVQADGTTRAVEVEKETDLDKILRQYVPAYLTEVKDDGDAKPAARRRRRSEASE